MPTLKSLASSEGDTPSDESLFERLARDIEAKGYSICPGGLPAGIAEALFSHQQQLEADQYVGAGVGRRDSFLKNEFVRSDEICWINGDSSAGRLWLDWAARLQLFLNRRLFLGLFSFESHFAHYAPGHYYKRHYDAFRGEANRLLSIAVYLNPGWVPSHAGELVIYSGDDDALGIKVAPLYGTVVLFLSEEFPHEVLRARRDRYSIAGWYRLNSSLPHRIDPPR